MRHQECVRILPEADTAVMLIHGIVGTPDHFRTQIPLEELIPDDWSVYNILLDGHGKGVEEFSNTSMDKWKDQVWTQFRCLADSHDRVILVAHSMGTLFALQLALEHPEKIPFLFLLGVPLRPGPRMITVINCFRVAFNRVREDRPLEKAMRDSCGLEPTPKLWKYLGWVPSFLGLFREIALTEKQLKGLRIPCVAYQSHKDELVTNFTLKPLKKIPGMEVIELPDSTHFYYIPEDIRAIRADFLRRCAEIKKKA